MNIAAFRIAIVVSISWAVSACASSADDSFGGSQDSGVTDTEGGGEGGGTATGSGAAGSHQGLLPAGGGAGGGSGGGAALPVSYVRLAHLAAMGDAYDFCLWPHARPGDPVGPVLGGAVTDAELGTGQVSRYFEVPSGDWEIGFVTAASVALYGCAPLGNLHRLVPMADGATYTVVTYNDGHWLVVTSFSDFNDLGALYPSDAVLRVGNFQSSQVSLAVAIDLALGGPESPAIFRNVSPGHFAASGEPPGYKRQQDGYSGSLMVLRAGTTETLVAIDPATLPVGTVSTVFSFTETSAGPVSRNRVAVCGDDAAVPPDVIWGACQFDAGQ